MSDLWVSAVRNHRVIIRRRGDVPWCAPNLCRHRCVFLGAFPQTPFECPISAFLRSTYSRFPFIQGRYAGAPPMPPEDAPGTRYKVLRVLCAFVVNPHADTLRALSLG